MKLLRLFVMFIVASSFAFNPAQENLQQVKEVLNQYINSGNYTSDLHLAANRGLLQLKSYYYQHKSDKLAVVFDLDETLLSNIKAMQAYQFGGNQQIFDLFVTEANASLLQPVFKIYQWAVQHDIAVYFITGRPDDLRKYTINNLYKVNINNWQDIYFWPRHSKLSVTEFKSSSRKDIESKGYKIVLNVGDQLSDLQGGYSQYQVKLPNPFYIIASNSHRH